MPGSHLAVASLLIGLALAPYANCRTHRAAKISTPAVALTFDDLPVHGPLPQGLTREDIANDIIRDLKAAGAPPTYGFVNAKRIEEDPSTEQVLQIWRDAGFPLGNHTYSHMDLNSNTLDAWEHDLLADEPILKKYMDDHDWHWLRFPFLHEGDTVEKHRDMEAFLKAHGYRAAEVTMSFGDYNYNEPYARCLAKNDQKGIDWLKESYIQGAEQELTHGQELAKLIYGRDIPHVMLLHIGGFETVMLPHLLELLKQRGFKLVTLPEAESDPAYAHDADLPGNWGGTFLQQMMREKHLQPPPHPPDDTVSKLNALCR